MGGSSGGSGGDPTPGPPPFPKSNADPGDADTEDPTIAARRGLGALHILTGFLYMVDFGFCVKNILTKPE